ncbi:MAG: DUF3987 domain-containing protein [Methylococcales bacterium]
MTVSDVLVDLKKFDSQSLADPIEEIDYGTTTPRFYANIGKGVGSPCINSFAHGADTRYFIRQPANSSSNRHEVPPLAAYTDLDLSIGETNGNTESAGETVGKSFHPPTWPDPQAMTAKITPEDYPFDALPDAIRAAFEEVAGFVKAPLPLVAGTALGALSPAAQSIADIERADRLIGPVGSFLLSIADSGERTTTCDSFFTNAAKEYEAAQRKAALPDIQQHKADIEAWDARRRGVLEKIRQLEL